MIDHQHYLAKCNELGRLAALNGNPPVGAVIVCDQTVISEAQEAAKSKNDITCHAEIEALRIAVKHLNSNDLSGCYLYTNYEPCIMCAYAIRYYSISKVIYQNAVPLLGGISSDMPLLTTAHVPAHWAAAPEIIHIPAI